MRVMAISMNRIAEKTYETVIVAIPTETNFIFFPITKFPTLSDSPV
jgi:hypothetical protein